MTLRQYVKASGGIVKASALLGLPRMTLYRWLNGTKPKSAARLYLASKGITA